MMPCIFQKEIVFIVKLSSSYFYLLPYSFINHKDSEHLLRVYKMILRPSTKWTLNFLNKDFKKLTLLRCLCMRYRNAQDGGSLDVPKCDPTFISPQSSNKKLLLSSNARTTKKKRKRRIFSSSFYHYDQ
jgi:hypothetical protein